MRRLGPRWHRLHRLIYPAALLGVTHFWWQVKADWREPLVYALVLAGLLGWRVHRARRRSASSAAAVALSAQAVLLRSFIQVCANTAARITATPR
jgi:DMSO/TMAO reductase YedYZ heme-binding membrane subunit